MRRSSLTFILLIGIAFLFQPATRADAQLCTGLGTSPVCNLKPFLWCCSLGANVRGVCVPYDIDILGPACLCSTAVSWKCGPCKLKAAAKRYNCRLKVLAKAVGKAVDPDFSTCNEKFAGDFQKCESRKGPCATEGDAASVAAAIDADVDDLLESLGGGSPMGAFLDGSNASTY